MFGSVCDIFICPPGEIISIIIEEYVQHLSGYLLKLKFDPSLLFSARFQYSNRIALEFCHLYHWHPLMPDSFHIDGQEIPYSQFIYNTSLLMHYGVEKLVDAFSRQPAGQVDKYLPLTVFIPLSINSGDLQFSFLSISRTAQTQWMLFYLHQA